MDTFGMNVEECPACGGEGVYGHDCGEDSCCCDDPEDNEPCEVCGGSGVVKKSYAELEVRSE